MAGLTRALILAAEQHDGQTDKAGNPFIFHPLRLLAKALTEEEQIVAVLHDIVEKTTATLEQLREEGFSEAVVEAVDALSRRVKESYKDYINRVKENPLARRVKIYDLQDNLQIVRYRKNQRDQDKTKKYIEALEILLG